MTKQDILVGGMALIEGVMMKSHEKIGIAVRNPKGKITTKRYNLEPIFKKYKIAKVPFIRGIFSMVEMMIIGIKALNYSGKVALEEEEKISTKLENFFTWVSMLIGLLIALFLFKFIPFWVSKFINGFTDLLNTQIFFNIVEGIIKISLFLGYVYLISLMPEIYRVFQYHGAEHKTVFCHEQKKKLTVENVKSCSRFHPRCGTSFIIFIVLLSIVVYLFIPKTIGFWWQFFLRLILLPVIAGISYEILKFSSKNQNSIIFKIISKPGLWTQHLTTKEPDKKQIEVAITALKNAV